MPPGLMEVDKSFGLDPLLTRIGEATGEQPESLLRVHDLGSTRLENGKEFTMQRAHVGPVQLDFGSGLVDAVAKGGIRIADSRHSPADLVKDLATTMYGKAAVWGLTAEGMIGGKGLIRGALHGMTSEDYRQLMRIYTTRMVAEGLTSSNDVPAPDMNTNPGLMQVYAQTYNFEMPDDENWLASVTGKPESLGGMPFRPEATGFAAARLLNYHIEEVDQPHDDEPQSVVVQGFGNAGSWFSHFATTNERTKVIAVSDRDGTIHCEDGLMITEDMAKNIGNDPTLDGQRMHVLYEVLKAENPNAKIEFKSGEEGAQAVKDIETDWFAPAAIPNQVDADYVLGGKARKGIVEVANEATTEDAHAMLVSEGKTVLHDSLANGGGVTISVVELMFNRMYPGEANMSQYIDARTVANYTEQRAQSTYRRLRKAAEAWGTLDLREASKGLLVVEHAIHSAIPVENDMKHVAQFEGMPESLTLAV